MDPSQMDTLLALGCEIIHVFLCVPALWGFHMHACHISEDWTADTGPTTQEILLSSDEEKEEEYVLEGRLVEDPPCPSAAESPLPASPCPAAAVESVPECVVLSDDEPLHMDPCCNVMPEPKEAHLMSACHECSCAILQIKGISRMWSAIRLASLRSH